MVEKPIKLCKYCNKEFEYKRSNKKFCSMNCLVKYNFHNNKEYREKHLVYARRYYDKIKGLPEYKEKRKKYFKEWLDKNREKWNKYYSDYHRNKRNVPK